MRLIVSGEGTSDLGACNNAQGQCSGEFFDPGPMAVWLARLWEALLHYNLLDIPDAVLFVSETALAQQTKQAGKRMHPLRGNQPAAAEGRLGMIVSRKSGLDRLVIPHRPPSLRSCNLATACCQIGPSPGPTTPEKSHTSDFMAMTGPFKDLDVARRKMPAHWSTRHA